MEDWLPGMIAAKRSDGIIVIGQSTEHKVLESVAKDYLPLVVWGGQIDHQTYCTVGSDNVGGARLATEHLLKLGRRRIVFLGATKVPEMRLDLHARKAQGHPRQEVEFTRWRHG